MTSKSRRDQNPFEAFRAMMEEDHDERVVRRDPAIEAEVLLDLAVSLVAEQPDFKFGDIVTWKEGLRLARFPAYGEPMVVLEFHAGRQEKSERAEEGGHAGALRDAICLVRDSDGDAMTHAYDSRRLRLMTPEELQIIRPKAA